MLTGQDPVPRGNAEAGDGRPAPSESADQRGHEPPRRAEVGVTAVALLAAEMGLLCVGLGTAFGFVRLFDGWGFTSTLGLAVGISWVLAVLTRRSHLGVGISTVLSAAVAVLALTWRFAPGSTWFGVPTPDTAAVLLAEVHRSFSRFSTLVAPVPASDGFLIVLAAVLWIFTSFADTAAFRYRGPVQAVVPYVSTFIAAGVLARDTGRSGAASVFLLGLAVYVITQRVLRSSERRWITGDVGRGTRALALAALVTAAAALLAGLVLGPLLPGGTEAVLDLRSIGRDGGTRTVVSPFVGVRSLLGAQSDQVVFTVDSPDPSYWRLTSLDEYDPDRDIWVSRATYRDVDDGELASLDGRERSTTRVQSVRIAALAGPWLPAAFVPRSIDIDAEVGFDARSSSIIARSDGVRDGTSYRVSSSVPRLDERDLVQRAAGSRDRSDLELPGVPGVVGETAQRITQGESTPYAKAIALQNWFRDGFTYSTDVDYAADHDPISAFLEERQGFCQQFASTFALMARSIGLPARVAVGFTPGDSATTSSGATSYVVRGRHAHAWPEVRFEGVGWVAFEPTPGRGNPDTTAYTGVPPQQALGPAPASTTTTVTPAPAPALPGPTPTGSVPADTTPSSAAPPSGSGGQPGGVDSESDPGRRTDSGGSDVWWVLAAAACATLIAVAAAARQHRHSRGPDPGGEDSRRVADAWRRATTDLARIGLAPAAAETPYEFARRAGRSPTWLQVTLDTAPDPDRAGPSAHRAAGPLETLAEAETQRRYGASVPDEALIVAAEEAASAVQAAVRSVKSSRLDRELLAPSRR